MRVRHGEPGVVGDHPEVRHVVVEPLEFEQHDPQVPRPRWHLHSPEPFERLTIRERVPDRGVAGDSLGQLDALGR